MAQLDSVEDRYMQDDARGIVLRFLTNAGTWRGSVARLVKRELRGMLG